MAEKSNAKKKFTVVLLILLVLVLALGGYLIYKSGALGGETSCEALLKGYQKAASVEDYPKVSEYFSKLTQKGCDF